MDITPGSLRALYTQYSQIFQQAFLEQSIVWPKVAQMVKSDSESETHVFVDRIPKLRQWVGDRILQSASLRTLILENKPYELTEALDEFRIKDNKIAAFEPVVRMIAEQAKKWPDTLLFQSDGAIANGTSAVTYDGVPFFSDSHPVNIDVASMSVQSNYEASSFPLTPDNFLTARAKMRAYKGADGLPLGVNPNLLVVGPDNEAAGIQILKEQWIAPTNAVGANAAGVVQQNPFYGTADLLVVDDLAGWFDGMWLLMDASKSIKPFLFQLREAAKFVMKTKPDDPAMFSRHEVQYGVSVRGAMGYGPWFFAHLASA